MDQCYVCYCEETSENPFCENTICKCKGSNRIHQKCFQNLPNQEFCSICRTNFSNVDSLIIQQELQLQFVVEFDKFGWKHEYYTDQRGRKHGLHRVYYKNGNLWEENEYFKGVRNGYQKVWSRDGQLFADKNFVNGVEV